MEKTYLESLNEISRILRLTAGATGLLKRIPTDDPGRDAKDEVEVYEGAMQAVLNQLSKSGISFL